MNQRPQGQQPPMPPQDAAVALVWRPNVQEPQQLLVTKESANAAMVAWRSGRADVMLELDGHVPPGVGRKQRFSFLAGTLSGFGIDVPTSIVTASAVPGLSGLGGAR